MDKRTIIKYAYITIIVLWLVFGQYSLWDIGESNMILCSRITSFMILLYFAIFSNSKIIKLLTISASLIAFWNLANGLPLLFIQKSVKGYFLVLIIIIFLGLWATHRYHKKLYKQV